MKRNREKQGKSVELERKGSIVGVSIFPNDEQSVEFMDAVVKHIEDVDWTPEKDIERGSGRHGMLERLVLQAPLTKNTEPIGDQADNTPSSQLHNLKKKGYAMVDKTVRPQQYHPTVGGIKRYVELGPFEGTH